ncbi:PTS system mannose/fructose/N-acetylgalactosamine-transporter subunit IIB [Paratissierella segnis]|uniref:PTS sugar transporter subunit IIB n=1 Tax=Paratissierella segnis TaxID=2763679 RepID=A0A926EZA6_9FIRM|nr:PTS sugar transporter subunit IIB [Paratissierella segnis]MBC8589162.1 PTS sugar transporter subunit IIB [Paratissierella segnis]
MASIKLIRVDSRLIHGQVITKWLKISGANRIIIIDDNLAQDSFMADIYMMAAPRGTSVEILDTQKAVDEWKKDELGKGNILILFKDVANCYKAFKNGFPIKELQIGGLASGPGRVTVFRAVSFDKQDVEQLTEMGNEGTKIILHIIPEEPKMEFAKAVQKFKG